MKTYLDCIPCFYRQALDGARLAGASDEQQKRIMDELARIVPLVSMNTSPPEVARKFYTLISDITCKPDPYVQIKEQSITKALSFLPELTRMMDAAQDRLLCAAEIAIAGNIIDYGVMTYLDTEKEIEKLFQAGHISKNNTAALTILFDYPSFKKAIETSQTVLFCGDNAGETVFDRILVEELYSKGKKIYYAIKDGPIINDALYEDAVQSGLAPFTTIISTGTDAPGIPLHLCSDEFKKLFSSADIIISKGQANYETLTDIDAPIFFLFRIKCPVVAKNVGAEVGSVVLKKQNL